MKTRIILAVLVAGSSVNGSAQTTDPDSPLEIISNGEIIDALNQAPLRQGPPPTAPSEIPHQQHSQNAPVSMQQKLMASMRVLPGVQVAATQFSLGGSQGWRLQQDFAKGPPDAFIPGSVEFGHLHRPIDGSMHMLLPLTFSVIALEKGWGTIHPLTEDISGENSEYVMIFCPRDDDELKTIWIIAQIAYSHGRGLSFDPEETAITLSTLGVVKNRLR